MLTLSLQIYLLQMMKDWQDLKLTFIYFILILFYLLTFIYLSISFFHIYLFIYPLPFIYLSIKYFYFKVS